MYDLCMYIYIYIYIYIYVYIYVRHANLYGWLVPVRVFLWCMQIQIYTCIYIYISIYLSIYISIDLSIYLYIHISGLPFDDSSGYLGQIAHRLSLQQLWPLSTATLANALAALSIPAGWMYRYWKISSESETNK